jgi:1-acyl-sn-glycerol-3-phosphate acyltransferase
MDDWQHQPARDHGLPPLQRWKSARREGGLSESVAQLSARTLVRWYLRLYHRATFTGREHLPRAGPFILSANHASHLDSVLLAQAVPWSIRKTLYPVAAGDVFFETPIIAAFAAYVINALPMWRKNVGRHALDDLRSRLTEDRCCFILFPEGRREPDGQLLPFKPGIGMMIGGTPIPVVPCYIDGAFDALPRDAVLPRPRKISVRIGPPMTFAHHPNTREGWNAIALELERAVRALGGLPPPVTSRPAGASDSPGPDRAESRSAPAAP